MTDSLILQNLRARLPATGPSLLTQYERAVLETGLKTTPEDAFAAWGRWLGPHPYEIEDWPEQYHQKVAAVIREVARYI